MTNSHRYMIIFLFLILFVLIGLIFNSGQNDFTEPFWSTDQSDTKSAFKSVNIDKWIVVTSINKPTDQIIKLASVKDFQLLVVADRKTDPNWYHEGAIFLGVDDQRTLGFRTFADIPFDSYTRKNIGTDCSQYTVNYTQKIFCIYTLHIQIHNRPV